MHTFNESGSGVPAFLAKLWRLVDDPETNNLICWSKDGRSFIIQNQAQFARELLPLNYKHNNMASFIRQLNMYGFHKITSIDNGGLKFDRDEMEFSHPCFKRNCPYLLEHIKRKIANAKALDEKSAVKPEAVSKVLQDVKTIRGRQESLDSRFSVMKQENEALWREIASLRQKHAKQQQIVNKLIQFLITIVQPSRNMTTVKRHMQLMIDDTPDNEKSHESSVLKAGNGPVIHELEEELLSDVIDPDTAYETNVHRDRINRESHSPLHIERPHSSTSITSQNYDYSNQSTEDVADIGTISANSSAEAAAADGAEIYDMVDASGSYQSEAEIQSYIPDNYNEDNILTTPMVREQIARSQLLKQKNKQRYYLTHVPPPISLKVHRKSCDQIEKDNISSAFIDENVPKIKSEQEIDPMLFLSVYSENRDNTPEPSMISPPSGEDGPMSTSDVLSNRLEDARVKLDDDALIMSNQSDELYNSNDFLSVNMPSDIFENSSLVDDENSKLVEDFKTHPQINQTEEQEQKKQKQLQGRYITPINGKFSSLFSGSQNSSGASTSAAAAAAAAAVADNCLKDQNKKSNNNVLAMTKYNKNNNNNSEGVLRDDVHNHLENMQDDLDTLKDLLRGDGYSLDANALLSLFNDADVLGPYGISMTNDSAVEKKGSELAAYQPIYDLSDIIDINVKTDLDERNHLSNTADASGSDPKNSTLNTPYHE